MSKTGKFVCWIVVALTLLAIGFMIGNGYGARQTRKEMTQRHAERDSLNSNRLERIETILNDWDQLWRDQAKNLYETNP